MKKKSVWIERYFARSFSFLWAETAHAFFWTKKTREKMTSAFIQKQRRGMMKTFSSSWQQEKRDQKPNQKKRKTTRKRTTVFVCTPMVMTVLHSKNSPSGHQRKNKGVSPSRLNEDVVVLRLPLFFFSLLSKRRDYVAFGASLMCARNFSIKCSVSTLETNKFKLVLPFQHVMANSDRKALSFLTSSSRSKQTKEP